MSIPTTANSLGPVHKVSKASTFSLKDNILKGLSDKMGNDATIFIGANIECLKVLLEDTEPNLQKIAESISDATLVLDAIKVRYGISDETIDDIKNNKLVDLAKVVF